MQSINFDDGYKTYDINNDESRTIRINVTDFNLLSRRDEALPKIEAIGREMSSEKDTAPEKMSEYDRRLREQINYIFGSDVCTPAFGTAHCMSIVGDGRMLFEGFVEALMAQVEKDMGVRMSGFKIKLNNSVNTDKTDKYIKPVVSKPAASAAPKFVGMTAPSVDISALSEEERKALLAQLMT